MIHRAHDEFCIGVCCIPEADQHRPDLFVRSYVDEEGQTITVHTDLCGCTTVLQTWPRGAAPDPRVFAAPSADH